VEIGNSHHSTLAPSMLSLFTFDPSESHACRYARAISYMAFLRSSGIVSFVHHAVYLTSIASNHLGNGVYIRMSHVDFCRKYNEGSTNESLNFISATAVTLFLFSTSEYSPFPSYGSVFSEEIISPRIDTTKPSACVRAEDALSISHAHVYSMKSCTSSIINYFS